MSEELMKSIVYEGANKIAYKKTAKPVPKDGEVLIKVAYTGICGTDLNIYKGAHPRATAPLIIGHELSGTIEGDFPGFKNGTKVTVRPLIFCGECIPCKTGRSHVCKSLKLYGIDTAGSFAEYLTVKSEMVHKMPDSIDLKLAAFAEPMAVGVHAVEASGVTKDSKVVLFGAGTIGLATAAALKLLKTDNILIVEPNAYRMKIARELGFTVIDAVNADVMAEVMAFTDGNGADFTIDCAAHPLVSVQLSKLTTVHGTIVIVGAYKEPAPFDFLTVMFKELTIKGVRVYEPKDFDKAIELLNSDFDFEKVLTHVLEPEQAQEGFDVLLSGGEAVKVLYKF